MKQTLIQMITKAAQKAVDENNIFVNELPKVEIEKPKNESFGDFSTNFALQAAKFAKMPPRKFAQLIVDQIKTQTADQDNIVEKIDIAGPGFINFTIKMAAWYPVLKQINSQKDSYGKSTLGQGQKIQVEFVSANPTGPLHVGHGRGAAVGDTVANILAFAGYCVEKEYYINDSGRQIRTLGMSVYLRYQELMGHSIVFPDECYQGDYVKDIARQIHDGMGLKIEPQMDEETAIVACAKFAASHILNGIKEDLAQFGVTFTNWFSEQSLYDAKKVESSLDHFIAQKIIYEQDGAFWFKTSEYGDEKDRVVIKSSGDTTYFASDVAYHKDKFDRGFNRVIDVWGADHHGYIPRMKACVQASGYRKEQLDIILVQLVNLLRDGQPVAMSTRSGEFVTLKEVVDEVGKDAARFIFLTRHYESPLDFDLELAKKQTSENPVYYVQYVHARISSIIRKAFEAGTTDISWDEKAICMLVEPEEIALIRLLALFPETIDQSAMFMEPHRVTFYLMNLSAAFHAYFHKHRVLTEDETIAHARLYLILAIKTVIRNGLTLLGVSAPEQM